MENVRSAVVYLSKGGSTKRVAEQICAKLSGSSFLFDLGQFEAENPLDYDCLYLGSPTYGLGELDYRWQKYLRTLDFEALRESEMSVALFVLGDQKWHGKTFAGSLVEFARLFLEAEISLRGAWSADGYQYEKCLAISEDGTFPGLVLDEVTQSDLTDSRIESWLKQVAEERGGSMGTSAQ